MNTDAIKAALNRVGQGLSAGDAVVMAEAWWLPATIFLDVQTIVAATPAQLADILRRSIQGYRKQQLLSTHPEIERIDEINLRLSAVRVRWPAFDRSGVERSTGRSFYVIEEDDDGHARIRLAATISGL
jgi:hypothetical protein